MMKTATSLLWFLLFVYTRTIETRSILVDSHSIANEDRHQLEHSSAFQRLRWTPRKLEQSTLCDLCDAAVPVVGKLNYSETVRVDSFH